MAAVTASYMCASCDERGRVYDEERGVEWYGCYGCERFLSWRVSGCARINTSCNECTMYVVVIGIVRNGMLVSMKSENVV